MSTDRLAALLATALHNQVVACQWDDEMEYTACPGPEFHVTDGRLLATDLRARGVRVGDDGLRAAVTDHLRAIDLEAKRRDDMTRVQFRAADLHEAEVAWKAAQMLVRDTLAALRAALAQPAPFIEGFATTPDIAAALAAPPALDDPGYNEEFPDPRREDRRAMSDWELRVAARRVAELSDQARHIVEFSRTGYGLQHPLGCRPNLLACPVQRYLAARPRPDRKPGRYFVDAEGNYEPTTEPDPLMPFIAALADLRVALDEP